MDALAGQGKRSMNFAQDRVNLELFCKRFQRGKACDMAMVKEFVAFKIKNTIKEFPNGKTGQKNVY